MIGEILSRYWWMTVLRGAFWILFGIVMLTWPGISLLSENVLRAADALVVPLVPTPLSLRMLVQLRDFIAHEGWNDLLLLPFFSMVDRRRSLHQELIASARTQFPTLLATEVPDWSEIERMSVRRAPVPACAPRSDAALVYRALWAEIAARIGLAPRAARADCDARETLLPAVPPG